MAGNGLYIECMGVFKDAGTANFAKKKKKKKAYYMPTNSSFEKFFILKGNNC